MQYLPDGWISNPPYPPTLLHAPTRRTVTLKWLMCWYTLHLATVRFMEDTFPDHTLNDCELQVVFDVLLYNAHCVAVRHTNLHQRVIALLDTAAIVSPRRALIRHAMLLYRGSWHDYLPFHCQSSTSGDTPQIATRLLP